MEQKKVNIFGLKVSTMGLEETKEWILARNGGAKVYCCTLNELVAAQENKTFKKNWFTVPRKKSKWKIDTIINNATIK